MTVLRGLHMFVAYTFLMPWIVIFGTGYFVYACFQSKKLFGVYQPIAILKGLFEGCGIAFKFINCYVKTGELRYDVLNEG